MIVRGFTIEGSTVAETSILLPKGKIVGVLLSVAGVGSIIRVSLASTPGSSIASCTEGNVFVGNLSIDILEGAPIFLFNDAGTGDPAIATIYVQIT